MQEVRFKIATCLFWVAGIKMSNINIYQQGKGRQKPEEEKESIVKRLKSSYENGKEFLFEDELFVYEAIMKEGLEKTAEELRRNLVFARKVRNMARWGNGIAELIAYRDLASLLEIEIEDKK